MPVLIDGTKYYSAAEIAKALEFRGVLSGVGADYRKRTFQSGVGTVAARCCYSQRKRSRRSAGSRSRYSILDACFVLAAGKMPFDRPSSGEIISAILRDEPPLPSRLASEGLSEMEAVIHKALEKDRNLRYQHASDMRADLQRLKRDMDSGRHTTSSGSAIKGERHKESTAPWTKWSSN